MKILDNISEKKAESPRKYEQRERNYGFPKPKIKDSTSLVSSIKKYNVDFPEKEFNNKLNEILKNNPSEILEKKLKDIMYDILDKKGTLNTVRILRLYHGSFWEKAIEEFMITKNYSKNGDDIYVHTEK